MIVLRFFPNGEFTQGVNTSKRRKKREDKKGFSSTVPLSVSEKHKYLTEYAIDDNGNAISYYTPGQQFLNQSGGIYTYLCQDTQGHHYAYECENYVLEDVLMNEPIGAMIARGEMTPLVHQLVESSPQQSQKSRKTLERMTGNMARNIRSGVYLLERKYGKDNLSFLTLTIPALCTEDLSKICQQWDYMVDQLLKSLRKKLLKKGLQFEYVYCTEIQTKRLEFRHEYVPHIHIVFAGRHGRKTPWAITPKSIRATWGSIIAHVVAHRRFDTSALENLQRIRKSAARYLSKYLSKGKCCNPTTSTCENQVQLRTQWGGMARSISAAIRANTVKLSSGYRDGQLVIYITREMDSLIKSKLVRYFKRGCIPLVSCEVSGVERVLKVGSGCLASPVLEGGLEAIRASFRNQQDLW